MSLLDITAEQIRHLAEEEGVTIAMGTTIDSRPREDGDFTLYACPIGVIALGKLGVDDGAYVQLPIAASFARLAGVVTLEEETDCSVDCFAQGFDSFEDDPGHYCLKVDRAHGAVQHGCSYFEHGRALAYELEPAAYPGDRDDQEDE